MQLMCLKTPQTLENAGKIVKIPDRLDHAITATQKTILSALDLSENDVKRAVTTISDRLKAAGA